MQAPTNIEFSSVTLQQVVHLVHMLSTLPLSVFLQRRQIGTQKHGFTNDFLDYFGNYEAGQVFKHLTSYSQGGKSIDVISRDYITQVQTNADLVQV